MGQTYDHRSSTISRGVRKIFCVRQQPQHHQRYYILLIVVILLFLPTIFISFHIFDDAHDYYDLGFILPTSLIRNGSSSSASTSRSMPPGWNLIVVAPTFYKDPNEGRFLLALESCRLAVASASKYKNNNNNNNMKLILVDASPNDEIRSLLQQTNVDKSIVNVVKQSSIGKGAALKEAIQLAQEEIIRRSKENNKNNKLKKSEALTKSPKTETTNVIAFMELEKVDMFNHWENLLQHMYETNSDICMPWRSDESFKNTYPIEQYYAETFANMYLNSLSSRIGMQALDWTIGPCLFRSTFSRFWLQYESPFDSYDVQLIPMINAYLKEKAKITSYEIYYKHSPLMKQMEEGSPIWSEKRFMQLDFHRDVTGKKLKEAIASAAPAADSAPS